VPGFKIGDMEIVPTDGNCLVEILDFIGALEGTLKEVGEGCAGKKWVLTTGVSDKQPTIFESLFNVRYIGKASSG
jgi:hypothetical protein